MRHTLRHPLIWLVLLVVLAAGTMVVLPTPYDAYATGVVLLVIAVAYLMACISILSRTRWPMWTVLGAGLLATMFGDAVVYTYILSTRIWVGWAAEHIHLVTAIVLSPLFAGGIFVVVGLSREWALVWRPVHPVETKNERDIRQDETAEKQAITGEHQAETGLVQAETERKLTIRGHNMTKRGISMDDAAVDQGVYEADLVLREAALVKTGDGDVPIPVALEKVVEAIAHIEEIVTDVPVIREDVKSVKASVVDGSSHDR